MDTTVAAKGSEYPKNYTESVEKFKPSGVTALEKEKKFILYSNSV